MTNPNPAPAQVTFLRESEPPIAVPVTIEADARSTLRVADVAALRGRAFSIVVTADVSVACERSMYFGSLRPWDGGHGSPGISAPAAEWFPAEGATGPFFDTYVLVGNPNDAPAQVALTFLLPDGRTRHATRTVGARARLTLAIEGEDPALADAAVSTRVTASVPVIVERAMYWPGGPKDLDRRPQQRRRHHGGHPLGPGRRQGGRPARVRHLRLDRPTPRSSRPRYS